MKICYIADDSSSMTGGAQSLQGLIAAIQKYPVVPYFAAHKDSIQIEISKNKGIPTKVVHEKGFNYPKNKFIIRSIIMYPAKRIYNLLHRGEMIAYLKSNQFDLVHVNSYFSSLEWAAAAKQCGIPYVWHLREYVDDDHNTYTRGKRRQYALMRAAAARIAISKDVQSYWSEQLGAECQLIYNGLDVSRFYCNGQNKLNGEAIHCLIVGRVSEKKGQLDAIKAIEMLNRKGITNVFLHIVGYRATNEYEKNMVKYVENHKLCSHIEVVAFTDNVKKYYEKCDVGLTCSAREAFGRVTIEYKMAGMLAIGTRSGGTPELIEEDKTGLLYDPGRIEELAAQLEWVIKNRKLAKSILLQGQKDAIEHYSIDRTAKQVYDIYKEVLQSQQKSH